MSYVNTCDNQTSERPLVAADPDNHIQQHHETVKVTKLGNSSLTSNDPRFYRCNKTSKARTITKNSSNKKIVNS